VDVACLEDDARFGQLYARCHRPIWDYCARRVPIDVVEDVVADTFLTVWRRLGDVPDGEEALLWMYGVAYRVIGHQWRSTARRSQLHERLRSVRPEPAAGEPVVDGGDHRLVLVALAALGETDAEVLRLVVWEHLSVTAVATVLGIRLNAARQRLHRARHNLVRECAKLQSRPTSTPAAPKGRAR
jgi:RNA polymerase sigma-70 factor (ECF subfamily)